MADLDAPFGFPNMADVPPDARAAARTVFLCRRLPHELLGILQRQGLDADAALEASAATLEDLDRYWTARLPWLAEALEPLAPEALRAAIGAAANPAGTGGSAGMRIPPALETVLTFAATVDEPPGPESERWRALRAALAPYRELVSRERAAGRLDNALAPDPRFMAVPPGPRPAGAVLASVRETFSPAFRQFVVRTNTFALEHGLRVFRTWSKIWEYPWLWHTALAHRDWAGRCLVDLGSEISPMPWFLATLGAKVTLIERDPQWVPRWEELRRVLGVDVDWKITETDRIPVPDALADVVTSFSVIEHQERKDEAIGEVVRVLKPGGLFALSFDVCEPEMGMTFPEWNGRALTLAEFEETVFLRPAFGQTTRPEWNLADVPGFLAWHRTTAPHHNYVVGAASLVKESAPVSSRPGGTAKDAVAGEPPPIFVLGVPRSGTTLVRALLDSHPAIACGPETPWLGAHQPKSVMALWQVLVREPWGYCASFGMEERVVTDAVRTFVASLMGEYARRKGKKRWAEKTPDNILYVDFLLKLFPEARFLHVVRDGLDVAISTAIVPPHRSGISDWHEKNLPMSSSFTLENNLFNALLRWGHWDRKIMRGAPTAQTLRVSYERLVSQPAETVATVLDFLGEPFDERVLDYSSHPHELPAWEWGSADVKKLGKITTERLGRSAKELQPEERALLSRVAQVAAGALPPRADGRSYSEERLTGFLEGFARSLGLAGPRLCWPRVWRELIERVAWPAKTVAWVEGEEPSPLPWLLSVLGADVIMLAPRIHPEWERLRTDLAVDVRWQRVEGSALPLENGIADASLAAFGLCEQPWLAGELSRVLKTGGLLVRLDDFTATP